MASNNPDVAPLSDATLLHMSAAVSGRRVVAMARYDRMVAAGTRASTGEQWRDVAGELAAVGAIMPIGATAECLWDRALDATMRAQRSDAMTAHARAAMFAAAQVHAERGERADAARLLARCEVLS